MWISPEAHFSVYKYDKKQYDNKADNVVTLFHFKKIEYEVFVAG